MGYGVADTNKDGTVSPEEWSAYQVSIGRNPDGSRKPGGGGNGFKTPFGTVHMPNDLTESESQKRQREQLLNQGGAASNFANTGEQGYGAMSAEAQQARDYLRRLASGQDSLSREQLRQGVQQNRAAQQSFAASAAPRDQAMAGIMGANNMARANYGMSGQAAMAGIAERQAASQALNQAILGARGQDLQAAQGSRQQAIGAYGGVTPEKSWWEKYGGAATGAASAIATMSDKRLKEDVEDGDTDANAALKGLRAYTFKYRDQKHGAGKQVGVMAQDLEKAGLKHAVFETPEGKAVHGGKLATANTAMLAALEKRVSKIEGRK